MLEQRAVDSVRNKEIRYLDVLRCLAALGVVMLHVCITEPSNYSIDTLGRVNSAFYYVGYLFTRWSVPAFLMITGSLLLKDSYVDTTRKYISRIIRMSIVLVLFGTGYAAMEIVFTEGLSEWCWILPKSLLRVLQMQSWDHLWYLYLLLGIYLLLPVLKAGLNHCSEKFIFGLLIALFLLDFAVPTINAVAGLSITNLYIAISSNYFYLICGYYLTLEGNQLEKPKTRYLIYGIAAGSLVIQGGVDAIHILRTGENIDWIRNANCFIPFVAIGIYFFCKQRFTNETDKTSRLRKSISRCSFGIYLLHPFWVNVLYKVLDFTPRSMPILLGIICVYIIVFVLSWVTSLIIKKIPFMNKLI